VKRQNFGRTWQLALVFSVLIVFPGSAYAYIDPGTGSLFLQLLFGGIGGLIFVLRAFRRRISGKFKSTFGKTKDLTKGS
jgi:hypothetical protein